MWVLSSDMFQQETTIVFGGNWWTWLYFRSNHRYKGAIVTGNAMMNHQILGCSRNCPSNLYSNPNFRWLNQLNPIWSSFHQKMTEFSAFGSCNPHEQPLFNTWLARPAGLAARGWGRGNFWCLLQHIDGEEMWPNRWKPVVGVIHPLVTHQKQLWWCQTWTFSRRTASRYDFCELIRLNASVSRWSKVWHA